MGRFIAILIVIFIALYGINTYAIVNNSQKNCQKIEVLKSKFHASAVDQLHTFPKSSLYRHMTRSEQEQSIRQLNKFIKDTAPDKCVGLFG